MPKHTIRINPDGTMAFLHDDTIVQALEKQGKINIERASDVSYDNEAHGWRVYIPGTKDQLLDGLFNTRAEALETEKTYLEARL
jgi:hypothetical protein